MKKTNSNIDTAFDNKERRRYYGLRIGDTVKLCFSNQNPEPVGEVIGYGILDNNRVRVKLEDFREIDCVAEHCQIMTTVENKDHAIIADRGILYLHQIVNKKTRLMVRHELGFMQEPKVGDSIGYETSIWFIGSKEECERKVRGIKKYNLNGKKEKI